MGRRKNGKYRKEKKWKIGKGEKEENREEEMRGKKECGKQERYHSLLG